MHSISSNKNKTKVKKREFELKLPEVKIIDLRTADNRIKSFRHYLAFTSSLAHTWAAYLFTPWPQILSLCLVSPWGSFRLWNAASFPTNTKCLLLICRLCEVYLKSGPAGWFLLLLPSPEHYSNAIYPASALAELFVCF